MDIETITQQIDELPEVLRAYIKSGVWESDIRVISTKHSLTPDQSKDIELEILIYLMGMQEKNDLITQTKKVLGSLPPAISGMIINELLSVIPQEVHTQIAEIFSQLPEDELSEETVSESTVPENLPTEQTAVTLQNREIDESAAGVDVIPEEQERKEQTTLGKNSLLNSIEHPEKAAQIEKEAQKQVSKTGFNPVASKLGGSTNTQGPAPTSPHYQDQDPYREPLT